MIGKSTAVSVSIWLCVFCWPMTSRGTEHHYRTQAWQSETFKRDETDTTDSSRWSTRGYSRTMHATQERVNTRKTYGPTDNPVVRSRQAISQELEDIRLANEHFLRMRTFGKCKAPRQRTVRVKDYYPDPTKEYLPRCTLLHRCGDDSGCCDTDSFECVARSVREVTLAFYTIHLGKHAKNGGLSNSVEKLLFINHTECECQPVNDIPSVQEPIPVSHRNKEHSVGSSRCRECPVPFSRRELSDGRCTCDCFDRHKPCLKIKRGRESLTEVERRCVESHHCHNPECEYGDYDVNTGKCPKRPDDYQRYPGKRGTHNSHRWTHYERD